MPRPKKHKNELAELINSCETPEEYCIELHRAKFIDREPFAQDIPVDAISYFSAKKDWPRVRALIEENNRKSAARAAANAEKPKPPAADETPTPAESEDLF